MDQVVGVFRYVIDEDREVTHEVKPCY
jgi:hypothetical protein